MYAAAGSDGNVHVYSLNLSNSAAAPAPVQAGSLSLAALSGICDFGQAETNLTDPTTLFVVLHIASSTGCGKPGDAWEVVRYKDSASTAPLVANINTTTMTALYKAGGALGGLVLLDSTAKNLNFYNDSTFPAPAILVGGVTDYSVLFAADQDNRVSLSASIDYFAVTTATAQFIYRVTSAGSSANVFTSGGTLGLLAVGDDTNMYFTDIITAASTTVKIYQEVINAPATPALLLLSAPQALGGSTDLIGSNASVVVFDTTSIGVGGITTALMTVPVGQTSTTATSIHAAYNGTIEAFMTAPGADNPPADVLFVTETDTDISGSSPVITYKSEAMTPTGTIQQASLANSVFAERTSAFVGSVFQFKGITDTGGGYGGAGVYSVTISGLAATPFTTTGGGAYKIPGSNIAALGSVSNTIGEGIVASLDSSAVVNVSGLAFDLSQFLIVPVNVNNSTVVIF